MTLLCDFLNLKKILLEIEKLLFLEQFHLAQIGLRDITTPDITTPDITTPDITSPDITTPDPEVRRCNV